LTGFALPTHEVVNISGPDWTLADASSPISDAVRFPLTRMPLDTAGVHEIKPALETGNHSDKQTDWASSWSAARAFCLGLAARRIVDRKVARSILWCMPRSARSEHGALYVHGLKRFGLARLLFAETGSDQDTLWALEEGLRSEGLALVVGVIDDVTLTPARRLALAAQKHGTPCLLLTHPRMPPVGATASRWRVAARPGAPHPLGDSFKGLGARRFALTLERCRSAPAYVTGRENVVEWSDETVCMRLVSNISDRSHAPRSPGFGIERRHAGAGAVRSALRTG
jgi:protein ImuA